MGVIITGMHRSGTSAVAGAVAALGISSGTGSHMPALPDNPRGYFERSDVAAFNDSLLERFGGSWDAPPDVDDRQFRELSEADLLSLRGQLDLFDPDMPQWFSKDPRLALLLPAWDRLCLRANPVILVVREPEEVTTSLSLRSGISERRGLAMWLRYYDAALQHSPGRPLLVLDYHSTLNDPAGSVTSIAAFLEKNGMVASGHAEAATSFEPALNRQTAETPGHDEPEPLRPAAQKAYQELAALHGSVNPATLPQLDVPRRAIEALDELTELYEARRAAGWDKDGRFAGSRKPIGQQTAEFERDRMEEDLVQTLRRLQNVQMELSLIKGSRTWRYALRAGAPLRKLRGR